MIFERKIMSGFLKDKQLGAKRLASMPDRLTNTVNLFGGGVSCRPTVINNYEPPLPDIATWWEAWKSWMFSLELEVPAKGGGSKKARPCSMLETIPRAKYPALTESEEAISVPLQTLCCAIFDAVLVHMLNSVGPDTWHGVKLSLCKALSTNKVALTLSILEHYSDCDIVFLQECSAAFAETVAATSALEEAFHVLKPAALDHKRDQNSLILLAKGRFDGAGAEEVTGAIEARMKEEGSVTLAKGDLCAYIVPPAASPVSEAGSWLLCSFHGDTDGLASVPLVTAAAAVRAARGGADALRLVIGLDANAHCAGVPGKKLGAAESSWGPARGWAWRTAGRGAAPRRPRSAARPSTPGRDVPAAAAQQGSQPHGGGHRPQHGQAPQGLRLHLVRRRAAGDHLRAPPRQPGDAREVRPGRALSDPEIPLGPRRAADAPAPQTRRAARRARAQRADVDRFAPRTTATDTSRTNIAMGPIRRAAAAPPEACAGARPRARRGAPEGWAPASAPRAASASCSRIVKIGIVKLGIVKSSQE
ncbi:unnamed protein product [Prorocentrum cordatum]|uniref:Endonuclease/exonuclease/phosphatase domain-containing protein n=1 Tax=Prorocentrum cordatum TaxID=2364126 RepID=A0ABN9X7U6_9DINO|nr:unnamed protein product [Polarella glacialis]